MLQRIAFIGTGFMGRPMAANLISAGFDLNVWTRTVVKAKGLAESGARLSESPAQAVAGVDAVVSMLFDGLATESVLLQPETLAAMRPGTVIVDMASMPPSTARFLALRFRAVGMDYLDSPVSGGTTGAEQGTLAIMTGGSENTFASVKNILAAMGCPVYVGSSGAGQLAKCVNQVIVAITIGAVAEGLLLAKAGGANPAGVRNAILGGFAESRILREHGNRMIERNFVPGGPMRNHTKDLVSACGAAADSGIRLPLAQKVHELFQALVDSGRGEYDHSAVLLVLEEMASKDPVE